MQEVFKALPYVVTIIVPINSAIMHDADKVKIVFLSLKKYFEIKPDKKPIIIGPIIKKGVKATPDTSAPRRSAIPPTTNPATGPIHTPARMIGAASKLIRRLFGSK